jgi:hypothetical protein
MAMRTLQDILDVVLAVLLALGCALSLPIYWSLFGTPWVRLWRWLRHRNGAGLGESPPLKPPFRS